MEQAGSTQKPNQLKADPLDGCLQDGLLLPPAERILLGRAPAEEILFALSCRLRDQQEIRTLLESALRRFGLEEVRSVPFESLDEETRRTAVLAAVTAHHPPRLIVLDSFADLEPSARGRIIERIHLLVEEGVSILFTEEEDSISASVGMKNEGAGDHAGSPLQNTKTRMDSRLKHLGMTERELSSRREDAGMGSKNRNRRERGEGLNKIHPALAILLLFAYAAAMAFTRGLSSVLLMGILPLFLLLSYPDLLSRARRSLLPILPPMGALLLVSLLWNPLGSWRAGLLLWGTAVLKLLFIAVLSLVLVGSRSAASLLSGLSFLLRPLFLLGINLRPLSVIPVAALREIPAVLTLLENHSRAGWRRRRLRLFLELGPILRAFHADLIKEGARVGSTLNAYGFDSSRHPLVMPSEERSSLLVGIFFTLAVALFILIGLSPLWEGVIRP